MREEVSFGLPKAFEARMETLLGSEYEVFRQSYESDRVQGLRFNLLKGNAEEFAERYGLRFSLRPVPWCREGYYYDGAARPGKSPCHEAGIYYIQEPSAMSVVSLLDPQPGDRVLDLCAAPGGKTTHIAGRLKGQGLLVSNEIHPARAKILSQNVERMGIQNGVVTNEDSAKLRAYFPEFFDRIVVDAPCSGEGMFRKDEQARNEWSEANVALCAERQQEILDNAAAMLKPGGRVVYSTCTFAPEEDEEGIAGFLSCHPEFFIVSGIRLPGLSGGRPEWSRIPCSELSETFRIWPHLAEGEGHYLALLEKRQEANSSDGSSEAGSYFSSAKAGKAKGNRRKKEGIDFWKDKTGKAVLMQWLQETLKADALKRRMESGELDRLYLYGDQIYQLPEGMPAFDGLRVLRPGLHLGTLKKNRLEPSHALALALKPEEVHQSLDLDSEEEPVRGYLSGNTLPGEVFQKGWVLICTDGCSLGWAKAAAGILKNHYPKGLRQ